MIASISRLAGVLFIAGASFVAAGLVGGPLGSGMAWAQSKAIQSQESNVSGVTVEIIECRRKEGVLTLKVRYRNTGSTPAEVPIFASKETKHYYVTAGKTKFLMLTDSQRQPLAVPYDHYGNLGAKIKPNDSFLFWAKYPAPPAEAKKVNFYNPHTPPFEDVPITD